MFSRFETRDLKVYSIMDTKHASCGDTLSTARALRWNVSDSQRATLEAVFAVNQYPDIETRENLALVVQQTETSVRVRIVDR